MIRSPQHGLTSLGCPLGPLPAKAGRGGAGQGIGTPRRPAPRRFTGCFTTGPVGTFDTGPRSEKVEIFHSLHGVPRRQLAYVQLQQSFRCVHHRRASSATRRDATWMRPTAYTNTPPPPSSVQRWKHQTTPTLPSRNNVNLNTTSYTYLPSRNMQLSEHYLGANQRPAARSSTCVKTRCREGVRCEMWTQGGQPQRAKN